MDTPGHPSLSPRTARAGCGCTDRCCALLCSSAPGPHAGSRAQNVLRWEQRPLQGPAPAPAAPLVDGEARQQGAMAIPELLVPREVLVAPVMPVAVPMRGEGSSQCPGEERGPRAWEAVPSEGWTDGQRSPSHAGTCVG